MTDTTVAAAAPETPKPKPRFVGDHRKFVDLHFPVEFDGKVYDRIAVAPCTVGEYNAAMAAGDTGRMPMFRDPAGELVPPDVLDALSIRDSARLNEVAAVFLPQNSQDDTAPSSTPPTGEA